MLCSSTAAKIAPSLSGWPVTAQAITSGCAPTILPIAPPAGEPLVIRVRYVSPNGRPGTRLWQQKAHSATAADTAQYLIAASRWVFSSRRTTPEPLGDGGARWLAPRADPAKNPAGGEGGRCPHVPAPQHEEPERQLEAGDLRHTAPRSASAERPPFARPAVRKFLYPCRACCPPRHAIASQTALWVRPRSPAIRSLSLLLTRFFLPKRVRAYEPIWKVPATWRLEGAEEFPRYTV